MSDDRRHPEVEDVSALVEGVLPADRSAAVRDHITSCDLCADVLASLESIRELLGTLPGPSRMPDDVAGRIDAALAAETHLESARPGTVSRETTPTEDAGVSRETTPRPPRQRAGGRPLGRADVPAGPGRPKRRRRRLMAIGTACCAAALAIGGVVHSMSTVEGNASSDTSAAREKPASEDPSAFAAGSLEKRVHALLAEEGSAAPSKAPSGEAPEFDVRSSPTGPLRAEAVAVPPCIQQATRRSETALAAQTGTFRGVESYLVVLPHPTRTDRVDAYVVDASCVREAAPGPGKMLLSRTYSRD
ncbi:anti-sigma factor family protein [Streptomyces meridianus]|uniref:Zinc-finger domain-containing protein n=1 Tax=Streptomyces meridianus TaxID=2938945 RepID=A0ABT0X9N3_9ACTN|nr:hypothetical protein [Streptomyces meridianus]MCM2578494.1 hypothetical protein [Streptomyces meridianus]